MDFENKIIELSDWLIEQSETYSEALIKLQKLIKDIVNEINLRAIEQKTKFEGEKMNPIQKLLKMMDWQDANRPLKVEEKAELMKLSDSEFEERLHQMAVDFKNDGVIRA
ncbi:hypothetical protein [Streptococcus sp. 400_SSPC]|uniref:hypothetical protein n=1 Tax=Streptococcus sp. 400_SSPC TaxID=1579341 RepID=UPI0006612D06|nr:hypothetical protein [Streptococcus sp. 400_SSPC]